MIREDIPKVLFSYIKEDDPYRASKLLQIEHWCYAHWSLHDSNFEKEHNFIAQVLSSEDCWKKVNTLHGVKLDRRAVGKKLLVSKILDGSENPFSFFQKYEIACTCCLEEDIRALFKEREEELSTQGDSSLLEYHHLVKCFGYGPLEQFWSHFVNGYISKLDLKGRHPYEYGLNCAISWKQAEAVEFFWNKIKSLPEDELSIQNKDAIFMKNAVYTAGGDFRVYSDIFEFFFDQINPDRYPELLKRDLEKNGHYGSLSRMMNMLNFNKFQKLFDCLKLSDISEDYYHLLLKYIEIKKYPEYYVAAATRLFMHIWKKEGCDNHRALVIDKEVMVLYSNGYIYKNLLVNWVGKRAV